jgi:hypothetical protein
LSSAKRSIDKKYTKSYWDDFANDTKDFITAKKIAIYILFIGAIVQTIGFFITPSEWMIWNALTFIVATNLGAVLLAIYAQRSADIIRDSYAAAFNGDFYHTLFLLSNLKQSIGRSADEEGISMESEINALGEDLYGVFKGYLETFNRDKGIETKPVEIKEVKYDSEDDLFE